MNHKNFYACPSLTKAFTLIELILAIVIIAICLTGTMLTFITIAKFGVDPLLQQQAINIGKSYLEEIMAKNFPETLPCPQPPIAGRAMFANVCDYHGLTDLGAKNQDGNHITGLEQYNIAVTLDTSTASLGTLTPGSEVIRIEVTITNPNLNTAMVFSSYKTKS